MFCNKKGYPVLRLLYDCATLRRAKFVHSHQSHNPCTTNIILNWVWILLVIEGWRLCKRDGGFEGARVSDASASLWQLFNKRFLSPRKFVIDNQRCIAHKRRLIIAHIMINLALAFYFIEESPCLRSLKFVTSINYVDYYLFFLAAS
jgi:hypothetical protein